MIIAATLIGYVIGSVIGTALAYWIARRKGWL